MVFKCQEDSFLKEFSTEVVSCTPATFEITLNGKKSATNGYEVVCKDTILFPEGGGQPYDEGFMNDVKVHQVIRKADQALHYVTDELHPGVVVTQKVNWSRRFDNMQQHSGQHLLSAVIERDYGIRTASWWLGEEICHVELETPEFSAEQIQSVEAIINGHIQEGRDVTVELFGKDMPAEVLTETRNVKGLPEDHVGDIRVINIDGIDRNMCCGTHVKNLSQLQAIKLFHCEKSKRKGQCLLYFVVGNRVLKKLQEATLREQKITALLNNGPHEHVSLIDKLQKNLKITNKNLQNVLKEIAVLEGRKIKESTAKYYCLHKKEAEPDFMNSILKEVGNIDKFLFLSTGEEKGSGNIVLCGQEKDISELSNKICDLLGGKGAGKGKRFQAKVTNMGNHKKVVSLLQEYFK